MAFSCESSQLKLSPPLTVSHDPIPIPHSLSCSSWEFLIGLQYELSVIRGRRPYMWTIWVCSSLLFGCVPGVDHPTEKIYSLTRLCTLISVILNMLALDSSNSINCQVRIISPGSSHTRADRQCLDIAMGYLSSREPFLSDKDPRLRPLR